MEKFIYTVTRTRTITERLVLKDSPKAFSEELDADSEVEARTMVKGMLQLRQHNKLLWQEISDVVDKPNVQIDVPDLVVEHVQIDVPGLVAEVEVTGNNDGLAIGPGNTETPTPGPGS